MTSFKVALESLLYLQWRIQAVWETGIDKFYFFSCIQQKLVNSDLLMHLIISKSLVIHKCIQKKKAMRQRGRSERRNCQRKCFHSFNYIIDHANIRVFFYVNSLHCFLWFFLYYLLHLISSDRFAALTSLQPYKFFIWIYKLFKNHPRKRVFRNVSLSNLENVLQRNLRTDRASKCIFRVSGGTQILEIYPFGSNHGGTLMGSMFVPASPKNSRYVADLYYYLWT